MPLETFYCQDCNAVWEDSPGFWSMYLSDCPECGEATRSFATQQEYDAIEYHDPEGDQLHEPSPGDDVTEDIDQETANETDAEADADSGADSDSDGDSDADGGGDGDSDGGGGDGP